MDVNASSLGHAKKYHAVVCGIAFNEDRYILEWVSYHLAIGFDHIFIYDNISDRPVTSLLSQKILSSKVAVIRWPRIAGEQSQLNAYHHFLHAYKNECEWAAIIDIDEFINLQNCCSIHNFLSNYSDADAICLNWRIFGSAGLENYSKKPLMERFQYASKLNFSANVHVKTIYKMSKTIQILIHNGVFANKSIIKTASCQVVDNACHIAPKQDDFDVAYINHYFVKSKEEWTLKLVRSYNWGTRRNVSMFDDYDQNEIFDNSIAIHLPKTRKIMRKIRRPIGLAGEMRSTFHCLKKKVYGL